MNRNSISIIIPVYLAEQSIDELVKRCIQTLELFDCQYEIILVDDQSTDNTYHKLKELGIKFPQISIYQNKKNIGQHPTIKKGLLLVKYNWVVIMDCDLQDIPEDISLLYKTAIETGKSVIAKRKIKHHAFVKRMISYFFNRILSFIAFKNYAHSIGNFGIYPASIIKKIVHISDDAFYFPVLINKAEKSPKYIYLEHGLSKNKKSTYSIIKLIQLSLVAFKATKQRMNPE